MPRAAWVLLFAAGLAGVPRADAAGEKVRRAQGTIERAFQESGFANPRVADCKRLE